MKTQQEYIDQGEQYILKTYNRFPVVLEKGEGVYHKRKCRTLLAAKRKHSGRKFIGNSG